MIAPRRLAVLILATCVGCVGAEDAKAIRDIQKCGVHAFVAHGRFAGQIYVEIRAGKGDPELQRIIPFLGNITRIAGLHLQDSNITDLGLGSLKGLDNIDHINLDHTKVGDIGLESLGGMSTLGYIRLTGTRVTDAGIEKLKRALPALVVERLTAAQDQALQAIYKAGGTVQAGPNGEITVFFAPILHQTDAQLLKLKSSLDALRESLEEIDLAGPGITDEGLKSLKGLTHLRRLKLTGTGVTDAGIRDLRKTLPQIEVSR